MSGRLIRERGSRLSYVPAGALWGMLHTKGEGPCRNGSFPLQ